MTSAPNGKVNGVAGHCGNCNAPSEQGFRFCGLCGAETNSTDSMSVSTSNPSDAHSANAESTGRMDYRLAESRLKEEGNRGTMFKWIVGVGLLLMGCAFLIGEWQRKDNGRYTFQTLPGSDPRPIVFDSRTGVMLLLADGKWVEINPLNSVATNR